jgi:legumain
MDFFRFFVLLGLLLGLSTAENWVLLVAGSNGWDNYRHQADICHAYQIFRNRGIPASNIVVMMYDDIAYNEMNPSPGVIINYPGGPNVYPGVAVDYYREDVNSTNFISILTGDRDAMQNTGSGKVIASGPGDRVFVYFSDHGGPGILAFPNDFLAVETLKEAVLKMHSDQKYKEMVFYIEACESGSMFWNWLSDDIKVYAFTAADPSDSSWGCFCDNETMGTCLADCYSIAWMLDTETRDETNKETFEVQYVDVGQYVANYSVAQQGCQYGELTMTSELLSNFFGNATSPPMPKPHFTSLAAVRVSDMKVYRLQRKISMSKSVSERLRLQYELHNIQHHRSRVAAVFQHIQEVLFGQSVQDVIPWPLICYPSEGSMTTEADMQCFSNMKTIYEASCGTLDEYSNQFAHLLLKACKKGMTAELVDILEGACKAEPQFLP